jgi:hypothetical protein
MRTGGRTDTHTDMTKLIVAFRNFAKAPKNELKPVYCLHITIFKCNQFPPPPLGRGFNELFDPVLGSSWPAVMYIIPQKLVIFIFSSESTS